MTELLIRLINPNDLRKLACRLVGRLQPSCVCVKRVLVVIGLPGAAGVWTAVILTLELEGGTASEKQSHQNTVRLHGRARKRWDISVHHRCCGGQTAPLQTTFTLTPITTFLLPTSGPGCDGWRWPPALYWLLNAQIDVHYSCSELIVWPHIPHLTTSPIYLRWQQFLFQRHFISAGGRVCLCSVALQRVDKHGDATAQRKRIQQLWNYVLGAFFFF